MRISFSGLYMSKARLETLVDGVFAIVMTLLVMPLVVPQRYEVFTDTGFQNLLRNRFHDITNYALSFVVLAILWVQHHEQSHFIKKTDRIHIWINIFTLMFVALFPFSTSLVNEFPERPAAEIIFGANMLIVSLLAMTNWIYSTRKMHLVEGITQEQIKIGRNKCVFFILVALSAVLICQSHPLISADIYWIIPIAVLFEYIIEKRT